MAEMNDWSPSKYHEYQDERAQPFFDLLALVEPTDAPRVVDLGCGTGELTRAAHERLGATSTLGVDSSPAMLEKARAHATDTLRFELGDLAVEPREGPFDVVLSNAALHWVPDHPKQLARIASLLAPSGQLAVQVPASFDTPTHLSAHAVAREPPFRDALGGFEHAVNILAIEGYARTLHALGFRKQHVRAQVYGHVLESRASVVDWFEGSLLVEYRKRLSPELYARFLARYREVLFTAWPDERPFFFPMKRVLFWARR